MCVPFPVLKVSSRVGAHTRPGSYKTVTELNDLERSAIDGDSPVSEGNGLPDPAT